MSKLYELLYSLIGKLNKTVSSEVQVLTEEQKAQARANIGADPVGTAESAVSGHNENANAHADIRKQISDLNTKVDNLPEGDGDITIISEDFLVTVEVESLDTETLVSDKTYAEIEEAILAGKYVRVKLISSSVTDHIYLQMVSHIEGSEIDFCGYFDNLPLLLKITA